MAFCANCGKEISDQAISCPNCGHPVKPVAAPSVTTTAATGQPLAEWWQRLVAALIDGAVVAIPGYILMAIIGFGFVANNTLHIDPDTGRLVGSTGFFAGFFLGFGFVLLLGIAYRVVLEGGPKGQTLGKMAMKIAVRDAQTGASIGYGRAFVRWLVASILWILFYIPGIIDVLMPLWDKQRQSIHDKAATSIVVVVP